MIEEQFQFVNQISTSKKPDVAFRYRDKNETYYSLIRYQSRYVHLVNLMFLVEYILPALGDYLVALKLGKFDLFEAAFPKLLKFYLTSRSEGFKNHES